MSFLRGFLAFLLLSLALTGVLAQQQQQKTGLQGQQPQQQLGQQQPGQQQQQEGQDYSRNLIQLTQQFLDKMAKFDRGATDRISETAIFIPAVPGMPLTFGPTGYQNCQQIFQKLFKFSNVQCEAKEVDPLRSNVYGECQISGMTYMPTQETVQNLQMGFMLNWGGDGKLNRMVSIDKTGLLNQLVKTKAEEHLDTLIMAGVAHATAQRQKSGGQEQEETIAFHHYYDEDEFDDDEWHHPKSLPVEFEGQQIRSGGQKQPVQPRSGQTGQSPSSTSTSVQGGQQQHPVPQLDELIDDQIIVRFHQMPAFVRSLLQDQMELQGKQQVRDTMRKAKQHLKLLGFEVELDDMNFRRVFATDELVVVLVTVGDCHIAIDYRFNEQGHLVEKDVWYLGTW